MKKILSIFLIFILLSSCSNVDDNNSEKINSEKIENVLLLKGESQKIAYSMLNKNEKYDIWQKKLDGIVNSKKLNDSQIKYINELKKSLNSKYLEKNANLKYTDYYNNYLKEMKKVGFTLFSKEEMITYFTKINETDLVAGTHCNCNSADDWCITGDCFYWHCSTGDAGCGWWLGQECNGLCAHSA